MQRSTFSSILVGFRTLRVNPLRTVLSTLGVIIGVAALVAVLALGDGMERFAREEIATTSSVMAVELRSLGVRELDGITIPDTSAPRFTVREAAALARLPGADLVSMTTMGSTIAGRDTARKGAMLRGTLASAATTDRITVRRGRFFTDEEVLAAAPVAVVSESFAQALGGVTPGDSVTLNGAPAVVIGVFAPPELRRAPRAVRNRPVAIVPVSAAERYQITSGQPLRPSIVLRARTVEEVRPLRTAVLQWVLANRPGWRGKVRVAIDENRAAQAARGILIFKLFMGAMTGISLLVGGIGIMNVLLASVVERTREIGIRKATGARQRDILVQFLSESVAISGMGSAIGLAVGFGGAVLATAIMRRISEAPIQAGFSVSTFVVTATAALFVGLVFGTYPALRAARLSPIEAMHHE